MFDRQQQERLGEAQSICLVIVAKSRCRHKANAPGRALSPGIGQVLIAHCIAAAAISASSADAWRVASPESNGPCQKPPNSTPGPWSLLQILLAFVSANVLYCALCVLGTV